MFPSSNDFSSSKSLISSSLSPSPAPRFAGAAAAAASLSLSSNASRSLGSDSQLGQLQVESDVTAETSLAESEPISIPRRGTQASSSSGLAGHAKSSAADKTTRCREESSASSESVPATSASSSSIETSYPPSNVSSSSSSRGLSSSTDSASNHQPKPSANEQRQRSQHHERQKVKHLKKIQADPVSGTTVSSSSSSSESSSISPCSSPVSSSSSLNENQPKAEHNLPRFFYQKEAGGKRYKIFNFLKIKSGMSKSKTFDQIKCTCSQEKKFDCLKCTSNYPVHVNRSKDGEEGRGQTSRAGAKPTTPQPDAPSVPSVASQSRPPLVVSVPVRRSDGSVLVNTHQHNRIPTRKTIPEFQEHQSMPTSKTFSNFTSLNPVPNASIKLKPSPFPASSQLMSFLEQLNPSNSFKVPPNASPFT